MGVKDFVVFIERFDMDVSVVVLSLLLDMNIALIWMLILMCRYW